jgi:hypothetical protein
MTWYPEGEGKAVKDHKVTGPLNVSQRKSAFSTIRKRRECDITQEEPSVTNKYGLSFPCPPLEEKIYKGLQIFFLRRYN